MQSVAAARPSPASGDITARDASASLLRVRADPVRHGCQSKWPEWRVRRGSTQESEEPAKCDVTTSAGKVSLHWGVVAHSVLRLSDMDSFSRSTLLGAVRVGTTLALALAAIGVGACDATPLQVSDGGAAGSASSNPGGGSGGRPDGGGAKSASCTVVLASDYDQSCLVAADCLSVGQVPKCPVTDCSACYLVAINKSEMARYMTALSQAVVGESPGLVCNCPCQSGFALCRAGK